MRSSILTSLGQDFVFCAPHYDYPELPVVRLQIRESNDERRMGLSGRSLRITKRDLDDVALLKGSHRPSGRHPNSIRYTFGMDCRFQRLAGLASR